MYDFNHCRKHLNIFFGFIAPFSFTAVDACLFFFVPNLGEAAFEELEEMFYMVQTNKIF